MKNHRFYTLMANCKAVVAPLKVHPYITEARGDMSDEGFLRSQAAFYPAVEAFPRHLLILLSRIPGHLERLSVLKNVVEEHGDFKPKAFHHVTFAKMLKRNRVPLPTAELPAVALFNDALSGLAYVREPGYAASCFAAIELGFSPISKSLGDVMVARKLVPGGRSAHYDVHSILDIRHAADLIRTGMALTDDDELIGRGFAAGVAAFSALYDGLLKESR